MRSSGESKSFAIVYYCFWLFFSILKHERALKLWQTGNEPTKDTKKSFVCKPWAIRTAAHYKVVASLSDRVWGEIHEASSLAMGSIDPDQMADDSDIEDPEDLVQLSSEPEGEA